MRTLLIVLVLALSQAGSSQAPQAAISNEQIRATLYLPDARAGYYRGTRFDWSGMVRSLTWNGHEYFGQWFERYDPELHDAITGPVEEFLTGESALGYDEVAPGGVFIRIGVGSVRKRDAQPYQRFETYDIVDSGKWKVEKGPDWIEFVHELDAGGYGYLYRKRLRLVKDTLELEHQLRNTGRKHIATSVYNHNFFTLDRQTTGPGFVVRFPFAPRAARPLNDLAVIQGMDLMFQKVFESRQTLFTEIEGFGGSASDYDFRIENRSSGAGVRIVGDRPMTKLLFWSASKTVCPEPYIDVSVDPGQATSWRITYEFYSQTPGGPKVLANSIGQ